MDHGVGLGAPQGGSVGAMIALETLSEGEGTSRERGGAERTSVFRPEGPISGPLKSPVRARLGQFDASFGSPGSR